MIKLVFCVRKRADVSDDEFHKYWLEEHGPLVRRYADAIGARKYIQSHTVEPELNRALEEGRGLSKAYDGITEVWWDSAETMKALSTPEGLKANEALKEDEAKFIDLSQSRVFMTEEHLIFDL